MSDTRPSEETVKEIAAALDRVVDMLPWQQTVFLRALGKKFEDIRDEFKTDVGLDKGTEEKALKEKDRFSLREDQLEAYVSLYNAQGNDVPSWGRIIENLSKQSISRPCYSTERAVREMIRSKTHPFNEGYVSVHIQKGDVRASSSEKTLRDRQGNVLLKLNERAITTDRVRQFYHKTGIYNYHKGILTRLSDMNLADE